MNYLESVLKALADKNRLRILKLLEKRDMCVCELAFVLGVSQPSVSRHLKKLGNASLIESVHESYWTDYHIKKDNDYNETLLTNLEKWLNDDTLIKQDARKAEKANREKLCKR